MSEREQSMRFGDRPKGGIPIKVMTEEMVVNPDRPWEKKPRYLLFYTGPQALGVKSKW